MCKGRHTTILANSNVIGVATNDEANVIHATTATEETLKDLLDGTGIETDKNTQYYVNYGWCEDGATEAVTLINKYANEDLGETNTYYNVNGVDVEVIDNNDDGTAEYVLYVQDTLSEVSRYSEKNETVSFYQPTLTNKGLPTGDADTTTRDFDDVVFNDEVDTNDLILYVEYGGRTYISAPEIVTDTMNRLDRDRDNELYITLDNGEEYRQSYIPDAASMVDVDMIHFDIDDRSTREDAPGFDDLFDFILDSNGYVVAIRPAEEQVTNYALVLDSAWTQNALRRGGDIKVLMADGTEGTYAINWDKSADAFEHVTNINGKTTARINGSTKDIADLDNDTKLELYLGTRDVIDGTGSTGDAASSVITYSLNADGDELTIESVLQKNQHVTGTIDIRDDVNTDDTAGVGDSGEIVYIDDSKVANTYYPLQYKLDEAYENGDGDIYIEHVTASNLKNYYAVDLDTVAFYYVDEDNYGVATGWDDMSNVADGTEVQVYPTLEKTTNRTYVATNLAGLILFNAEVDTDSDDYMLVLDANAAARGDKWYLTVVFEDGNVAEISVDDDDLGDFDPDINGDFMQAYAYKENSDGTYSVGDMADNYGKGTAHNYSNRTIAFTQNNRSHYIALANDANVWDVEDVENDGDEAVATNFTKTEVNAVVIMDGGSIRTAWVWDIPQKPDEDVDFDTDTVLVDVIVDGDDPANRTISIEYIGEEPSASDLRTLITNELLSYYSKAVNGESTKVEITRFNDRTQEVTAEVTKTNEGVSTEKWTYTFVNDDADEAANDANWGVTDSGANYTPNGSWDVSGNVITATGFNNTTESMNDIARFLGALYRTSGAEEIRYDGKVYNWNKAGTLKGSNWTENGDPMVASTNTLVSAIKADLDAGTRTFTLLVDGVEMTINVI